MSLFVLSPSEVMILPISAGLKGPDGVHYRGVLLDIFARKNMRRRTSWGGFSLQFRLFFFYIVIVWSPLDCVILDVCCLEGVWGCGWGWGWVRRGRIPEPILTPRFDLAQGARQVDSEFSIDFDGLILCSWFVGECRSREWVAVAG